MDKRQLLDRAASGEEERLLLGRVLDKYEQCRRRGVPSHTAFLSPQEQAAAGRLLQLLEAGESFLFWGGWENAERRQLHFLPDWQTEPERGAIRCLRCAFYDADALTHRDFLGSLMALGLTRESVGDILVGQNRADIFVCASVAEHLLREWRSAGRVALRVTEIAPDEADVPAPKIKEVRDTVSSPRLDSVLSVAFSLSRGKAAEAVARGRVQVNWTDCLKPDKLLSQGDVISLRGFGKCRLQQLGGVTKKGRQFITVERFL